MNSELDKELNRVVDEIFEALSVNDYALVDELIDLVGQLSKLEANDDC
jgi:hypothetical protein